MECIKCDLICDIHIHIKGYSDLKQILNALWAKHFLFAKPLCIKKNVKMAHLRGEILCVKYVILIMLKIKKNNFKNEI
jgi:hypothetical protein